MSLMNVFGINHSALVAQSTRINLIAENLANADVAANSPEEVYKPKYPIFSTLMDAATADNQARGVTIEGIATDDRAPRNEFNPGHAMADENGFIYMPNVNPVQEMANMMGASRAYQTNIELMNSAKNLLMRTLTLGQ